MRPFLVVIFLIGLAKYGSLTGSCCLAGERAAPARLEFEKRLLDGSAIGVLFPTFVDFDGDGKTDLVVGVHGLGQGRLRDQKGWAKGGLLIYLNRGTNAAPEYAKPFWFDDRVPSGVIPSG